MSKSQTPARNLLSKLVATPGYSIWLFGWVTLGVLALQWFLDLFANYQLVPVRQPDSKQPLVFNIGQTSLFDTVLITVFNLLVWYAIGRLAAAIMIFVARRFSKPDATLRHLKFTSTAVCWSALAIVFSFGAGVAATMIVCSALIAVALASFAAEEKLS